MTANSPQTIAKWLNKASAGLKKADITSYTLDALILLEFVTKLDRAHILAHDDKQLTHDQVTILNDLLARRIKREPIAYITESVEFYGRTFMVNQHVLIPRPESEAIIEELRKLPARSGEHLIDVGTGSGILGITAALELPGLKVELLDISVDALDVARRNAHTHKVRPQFIQSNLLADYRPAQGTQIDIIVANLPYVDKSWQRSPETDFEPKLALFANNGGLALIFKLIEQAKKLLRPGCYLLLEADPEQFNEITKYGEKYSFKEFSRNGYCIVLRKS